MDRQSWGTPPGLFLPHWGSQVRYLLMQMNVRSPCLALGHKGWNREGYQMSSLSHTMSTPKDKTCGSQQDKISWAVGCKLKGHLEPQRTTSRYHHLPEDLVRLEIQVTPAAQEDPEEEQESVRQC